MEHVKPSKKEKLGTRFLGTVPPVLFAEQSELTTF